MDDENTGKKHFGTFCIKLFSPTGIIFTLLMDSLAIEDSSIGGSSINKPIDDEWERRPVIKREKISKEQVKKNKRKEYLSKKEITERLKKMNAEELKREQEQLDRLAEEIAKIRNNT